MVLHRSYPSFLVTNCILSEHISWVFILDSKYPVVFPSSSLDSSQSPSTSSGCLGTLPTLLFSHPTVCRIVIGLVFVFTPLLTSTTAKKIKSHRNAWLFPITFLFLFFWNHQGSSVGMQNVQNAGTLALGASMIWKTTQLIWGCWDACFLISPSRPPLSI